MLNPRQRATIQSNRERIRQDRLRTVILIRFSAGITTFAATTCMWREMHEAPPGTVDRQGRTPVHGADVRAEFPPDVDFSTVVAIADAPDASQVGGARLYRLLDRPALGLMDAPDRILVFLERLR